MSALSLDERQELGQAVRAACARLCSEERVRRVAYECGGFDAELWTVLCGQVGVGAIGMPEDLGGAGFGASALAIVAHELGRTLAPVPFLASAVLATGLLVEAGASPARLEQLAEGRRVAAAVITGDGGFSARPGATFEARQRSGEWRIDGKARHVLHGTAADDLVVVAMVDGKRAIFLIDTSAAGVVIEPEEVLDSTRPMASIALCDVAAEELTANGPVDGLIDRCLRRALAVLSAEQVGACERILEIATEYARTREQFGRPIGSFQAIKHRCADMLVELEFARSASQAAVEWADGGGDDSWRVSMAKAVCSEVLRNAAHSNMQIHGGIGFTWEGSAGLYMKRARTDEVLFGLPGEHWDRVATEAKLF
ncbi:acyl-CoA dehydrogenase family protein [Mycobacterium colombiense]